MSLSGRAFPHNCAQRQFLTFINFLNHTTTALLCSHSMGSATLLAAVKPIRWLISSVLVFGTGVSSSFPVWRSKIVVMTANSCHMPLTIVFPDLSRFSFCLAAFIASYSFRSCSLYWMRVMSRFLIVHQRDKPRKWKTR